jgi:hypothetical protein
MNEAVVQLWTTNGHTAKIANVLQIDNCAEVRLTEFAPTGRKRNKRKGLGQVWWMIGGQVYTRDERDGSVEGEDDAYVRVYQLDHNDLVVHPNAHQLGQHTYKQHQQWPLESGWARAHNVTIQEEDVRYAGDAFPDPDAGSGTEEPQRKVIKKRDGTFHKS